MEFDGLPLVTTIHASAVLRTPDDRGDEVFTGLVGDLEIDTGHANDTGGPDGTAAQSVAAGDAASPGTRPDEPPTADQPGAASPAWRVGAEVRVGLSTLLGGTGTREASGRCAGMIIG